MSFIDQMYRASQHKQRDEMHRLFGSRPADDATPDEPTEPTHVHAAVQARLAAVQARLAERIKDAQP